MSARESVVVRWADLRQLSRFEVAAELTLSLPWLVASLLLASRGHLLLAPASSFMFFLTGLRQAHNAYHHALGLSRRATHAVMLALSIAMLGSMHAIHFHAEHHLFPAVPACKLAVLAQRLDDATPRWAGHPRVF